MTITRESFGVSRSNEDVSRFTLTNAKGAYVKILTFGCILQSIGVPDRDGNIVDVCLGFDTLEEYENTRGCYGAVVGRCANRIQDGRFEIDGRTYYVALNSRGNHIHGGVTGFDRRVWAASSDGGSLRLSYFSKDGEEGYPGNMKVTVEYSLSDDCALSIRYFAESDADTIINLTNHCYFNLNGHDSGSALGHTLRIDADEITEAAENGMLNGHYIGVDGTPFDFRTTKTVSRDIDGEHPQLKIGGGYDHNFVLRGSGLREIAELCGDRTGIGMKTFTDQPGVQLYTSNGPRERVGKGGAVYGCHGAVCLETQHFPNTPANPGFPSIILRKGEKFSSETIYSFYTK